MEIPKGKSVLSRSLMIFVLSQQYDFYLDDEHTKIDEQEFDRIIASLDIELDINNANETVFIVPNSIAKPLFEEVIDEELIEVNEKLVVDFESECMNSIEAGTLDFKVLISYLTDKNWNSPSESQIHAVIRSSSISVYLTVGTKIIEPSYEQFDCVGIVTIHFPDFSIVVFDGENTGHTLDLIQEYIPLFPGNSEFYIENTNNK